VWIITAGQHVTRTYFKGFQEVLFIQCSVWGWWCVVEWQWRGMLGMLGVSVMRIIALTVKLETVTLIG